MKKKMFIKIPMDTFHIYTHMNSFLNILVCISHQYDYDINKNNNKHMHASFLYVTKTGHE